MNKIISMTAYGTNPRYFIGAKRQVELAKKYYPNWLIRIYTDNLDKFKDIENEVQLIQINDDAGVFWRFYPMFESDDNIVIVRDTDGRITFREALAVQEWLDSPYAFHTWKDHEAHYEFPIIACAFGYKGKFNSQILYEMKKFQQAGFYYLNDQHFLRDFIYPIIKNNTLLHDFNQLGWFKDTRKKLINPYDFCGNGYDENDMPLYPNSLENIRNFDRLKLDIKYKFNEGILQNE